MKRIIDWFQETVPKKDRIFLLSLVVFLIALLVLTPFLPDLKPDFIKRDLKKQGYNVEALEFRFIKDGKGYWEWIYESSEPVIYENRPVSQWSLLSYGFLVPFVSYRISPYPPLPKPVTVSLSFSAEELERITEAAGGEPVEAYIKGLVEDRISSP